VAEFSILREAGVLVVLGTANGSRPSVVFAGPDIAGASAEELEKLQAPQHIPGGPVQPIAHSLSNAIGTGWPSAPGLVIHQEETCWAVDPRVTNVEQADETSLTVNCFDPIAKLRTAHHFSLCPESGVLSTFTEIESDRSPFQLEWCAALCLPFDDRLTRIRSFSGKWASEFQIEEIERFRGSFLRENRAGRTSHSDFPGLFLGSDTTDEQSGLAAAVHLGWSGNNRLRIDTGQDGSSILQAGELLLPGEISLGRYRTPELHVCWSCEGYGDVSRRLHRYARTKIVPQNAKPRSVHYNTWEAVYFDHSETRILELVDKAAEVGAQRFVLDDGWFGSRRNDKAGLGEWWVSREIYPGGLHEIVERVRNAGMEFGLWFEPEMVNPDSDLYRAHPEWVLGVEGLDQIASRNQLVLDLTRPEVRDYLFAKIDALISEYDIDYIKWDMNRDIQHPGDADGKPAAHRQTHAVYSLIDRLRKAHPDTEIESCSSGGARADYGILRRTDRIWTSDNNDARHRHQIMYGASHFFPLSVLGNHVGPKKCHITGRQFSMEFRAASAIFGHMGMELDLAYESEEDRTTLASAIALHKQHRELIHSGELYRLQTQDCLAAMGCVAKDKSAALFSCALLDMHSTTTPPRLRFSGLDPSKRYRTRLVWPERNVSISSPSIIDEANLYGDGTGFSGGALMEHGIQLPLIMPDTCLIFHLRAEN